MFLGIKFPPEATISFMGKFSMLSKLTLDFLQVILCDDIFDMAVILLCIDLNIWYSVAGMPENGS